MATRPAVRVYPARRPQSWWLKHPRYFLFMMRELSSIFVAAYAFLLIYQLWQFRQGEAAYSAFLGILYSGPMVAFTIVVLAFTLLHAVTWLWLTTKVPLVRFRGKPASAPMVFGANLVLWAAASALVLFLVYGGI